MQQVTLTVKELLHSAVPPLVDYREALITAWPECNSPKGSLILGENRYKSQGTFHRFPTIFQQKHGAKIPPKISLCSNHTEQFN